MFLAWHICGFIFIFIISTFVSYLKSELKEIYRKITIISFLKN